jgi:hypothetical protein
MQIRVRPVALFLFAWIISRAIGRKELAELSSFELILLIVMGDLIQQGVTGDDRVLLPASRRRSFSAAAGTGREPMTIPDHGGSVSAAPRPGRGGEEWSGTRLGRSRSRER